MTKPSIFIFFLETLTASLQSHNMFARKKDGLLKKPEESMIFGKTINRQVLDTENLSSHL